MERLKNLYKWFWYLVDEDCILMYNCEPYRYRSSTSAERQTTHKGLTGPDLCWMVVTWWVSSDKAPSQIPNMGQGPTPNVIPKYGLLRCEQCPEEQLDFLLRKETRLVALVDTNSAMKTTMNRMILLTLITVLLAYLTHSKYVLQSAIEVYHLSREFPNSGHGLLSVENQYILVVTNWHAMQPVCSI